MSTVKVWFEKNLIFVKMADGDTKSVPLKAFPRLYNATPKQRENYNLSPFGIHWQELDEDLSFEGFKEVVEPNNEIARIFQNLPEVNVNQFARIAGINQSLMAKYICGIKKPSEERERQIKEALHRLGTELSMI